MATVRDRVDALEKELASMKAQVESAYNAAIAAKSPPVPEATSPAPEPAETPTEAAPPA